MYCFKSNNDRVSIDNIYDGWEYINLFRVYCLYNNWYINFKIKIRMIIEML